MFRDSEKQFRARFRAGQNSLRCGISSNNDACKMAKNPDLG